MAYLVNSDIQARLGDGLYVQLTDDAGTGSADEAKVDEARLAAEGEVNSFLARRYAVPVDTTAFSELAGVLKSLSLDLAEFRLHSRRPPVRADVTAKRNMALKLLSEVAEGKAVLPSEEELPANGAIGPIAASAGESRHFTREEMEGL
jgi:phage gp36-like protein